MYSVGMKVNNGTKSSNKAKTTISFQSNEAYKVRFRIHFHMFDVHFVWLMNHLFFIFEFRM